MKTFSNPENIYVYRIDGNDNIIYVSDNWNKFAKDNGASKSCLLSFVLNKPLWDFIADIETIHLYKLLVEMARTKKKSITVPIRCDSPNLRRFIEIIIKPLPGNSVEFSSQIIRVEQRDFLEILDTTVDRSEDLVCICSYCKKIEVSENEWLDTEKAVEFLDLFKSAELPQLTHSVCPVCYKSALADFM